MSVQTFLDQDIFKISISPDKCRRSGNKSDRRVDLDAVNEGVMEQMDREMEIYTGGGRPGEILKKIPK